MLMSANKSFSLVDSVVRYTNLAPLFPPSPDSKSHLGGWFYSLEGLESIGLGWAQAPVFSASVPRDADVDAHVRNLVIHQLCPRAQRLQQVMVLQIMGPVLQMKKLGFPWRTLNLVQSHTILSKSPVSGELWDDAAGASWTPVD